MIGLVRTDFRVFDEGAEQMLTGFAAEEQQLDLILLFDASGSMRNQVARIASAAREAFHELREGDRVSVMTFTTGATLVSPFTTDLDSIERDIRGILNRPFRGGTQIREAIYEAANYFLASGRSQRRRAILIITDNLGGHKRSESAVVTNLWEADAVLSGIVVPPRRPRRAPKDALAELLLEKMFAGIDTIAQKTGGEALHSDDPGSELAQVMHRIRNRYSLYYPTPKGAPGSVRSIRVELTAETQRRFRGARVLARKAYTLNR
jgi:VWFA-related protein